MNRVGEERRRKARRRSDRGTANVPALRPGTGLDRARVALTFVLVVFGMLVSGGPGLFFNALVELLALALLAVLVLQGPGARVPPAAWVVIGLAVAIPVVQLIPLPAALWTALPGRDLVVSIDQTAGLPLGAHPLSLDPDATRRSMVSLLPAIALFVSAARAKVRERVALATTVLALAALSALLGVFQFAAGTGYLYDTAHAGWATGLFNNRNQNADLLLAAMALVAALGRVSAPREWRVAVAAALPLLALCCLATGSRMGVALMPGVLAASVAILFAGGERGQGRVWPWLLGGAGVAALALVLVFSPAFAPVFARFGGAGDDARFGYWQGVVVTIKDYFPVGSGLGSFVPVYASVEDLDTVTAQYVNHAHNEYLEIALETGVAGLLALLLYLLVLARAAAGAFSGRDWPLRAAGLVIAAVMLAHSAVEFPLRNFILLIVWALANAFAVTVPVDSGGTRLRKSRSPRFP